MTRSGSLPRVTKTIMRNLIPSSRQAFTLIEIIVYGGLVAVFGVFVIGTVSKIIEGNAFLSDRVAVEEEVNFLMRKIVWATSGATAINTPSVGSSGSELSVTKAGFAANPIVFELESGSLRLSRGVGEEVPLSSARFPVDAMTFTHQPANGGEPEAITVDLTIKNRSYGTTIYLRK